MKITISIKTEKIVEIPSVILRNSPIFQNVIDYLKTLTFIGGSHHDTFDDYLGKSQGGKNASPITYIETLCENDSSGYPIGRITVRVGWNNDFSPKKSAILIFQKD